MLTLTVAQREAMIATCIRALPDEGCGLLLGDASGTVSAIIPSENMLHSAKVYEIDPKVLLKAYRRADDEGVQVIGVFHSHTHSAPFPSPTDIAQAPDPSWHYVLVSLQHLETQVESYSIIEGVVAREDVFVR